VTVVRRLPDPVDWASRTISLDELDDVLPDADVVIVAAALTGQTRGLFDAARLALLKPSAVLVNIARGALVDSDALVGALSRGELAGAALDVTDPEPLPDGHPLWAEPRALITPHTADTMEMIVPLLADRIADNVARFGEGRDLAGQVDPAAGY
jgi:phosphoglycerate dehydrogenase-like enzyme